MGAQGKKGELRLSIEELLEHVHESITITDSRGVLLLASKSCGDIWGFDVDAMIGSSMEEFERLGIFRPSLTLQVIRTGRKISAQQPDKEGVMRFVTALPVFGETGELKHVVTYSSWNLSTQEELLSRLNELKETCHRQQREMELLRESPKSYEHGIVAESRQMKRLMEQSLRLAPYDAPVIITGEIGVGKSMLARFVHKLSRRADDVFISVNCRLFPGALIGRELFGSKEKDGDGAWHVAGSGTLFLEEIDALSLSQQVELERRLEEAQHGGQGPRLIVATDKNLKSLVAEERFREDLYYRLAVILLEIPPLRERPEDTLQLLHRILSAKNICHGTSKFFSRGGVDAFLTYNWPSNVPELENMTERLLLTTESDCISIDDLPEALRGMSLALSGDGQSFDLRTALEFYEARLVNQAYSCFRTTMGVARALGISQSSAVRKLQQYCQGYGQKKSSKIG